MVEINKTPAESEAPSIGAFSIGRLIIPDFDKVAGDFRIGEKELIFARLLVGSLRVEAELYGVIASEPNVGYMSPDIAERLKGRHRHLKDDFGDKATVVARGAMRLATQITKTFEALPIRIGEGQYCIDYDERRDLKTLYERREEGHALFSEYFTPYTEGTFNLAGTDHYARLVINVALASQK